jgi:hypothetical protein
MLLPSAFVRFFCLPKKKNQKKGHLAGIAPLPQGSQRTTVKTTGCLMHFEYSHSLSMFTSLQVVTV